jgi:hypothetical protein
LQDFQFADDSLRIGREKTSFKRCVPTHPTGF